MRFMVIVKSSGDCTTGATPNNAFIAAMQKFNDELAAAGVIVAIEGLRPLAEGVRARVVGGKWRMSDGPFAETKEVIGGYWLWQVTSRDEAMTWLNRCPFPAHGDTEIELREVLDTEQFAAKLAPAFVRRAVAHA